MIKNETKNVGVCGETESLQNASHSQERERKRGKTKIQTLRNEIV